MQINKNLTGATLTLEIEGRIDTTTAPALEAELKHSVTSDVQNLIIDFAKVEYISSAGLRVLLAALKVMKKQGTMTVQNVNDAIMEVFEVTGFSDILTIV
ncbi:MAG: STAS domain-containing protein [Faecousia sp.]